MLADKMTNKHSMKNIALILTFLFALPVLNINAQTTETDVEINKTDANGLKQGTWKKTSKEGKLIYTGFFLDGKPEGHFIYYDTTGFVKAESDFTEKGTRSFTVTYFRTKGKMSEGLYVNEKRDGVWKYYNEEGIMISEEGYRDGIADGVWKTYYANKAILEEISYHNGKKDGPWKQYFYDGPLKLSATYKNGKLEGLATFFHPNGRVMVSGPYVNNMKDGVWMHIDDKGVAQKREVWSNGILSIEEYYDKSIEKMVKEEK
jgi:antitoxin component YwqK of YwqJK toxin-antitoxin module